MTKAEIIDKIAEDTGLAKKDVAISVEAFMESIREVLAEEKENVYRIIGLGALKYFLLKVNPVNNMVFNPAESIDFNGNTGPFIQYTHARIKSVLRTKRSRHCVTY